LKKLSNIPNPVTANNVGIIPFTIGSSLPSACLPLPINPKIPPSSP